MPAKLDLVRESIKRLEADFAELGFAKLSRGLMLEKSTRDARGWIGLNIATQTVAEGIGVNPVIGVRHLPIENLLAELGYIGAGPESATIYMPLSELLPEEHSLVWEVTSSAQLPFVAGEILTAFRACGLPFIDTHRDFPELLRFIERELPREQRAFRRPAAYLLANRDEEARQIVDDQVSRLGNRRDGWAEAYRSFATNVLDRATR